MVNTGISLVWALLAIGIHYEALELTTFITGRLAWVHRLRVGIAVTLIVIAHLIEVIVFAFGWALLLKIGAGSLSIPDPSWLDLVYFSGTVYSTVGFGDIVPIGPSRILSIVESVTGLVLIAWTASFTFMEMRRSWNR